MELRSATSADVDAILAFWVRAGAEPSTTDDAPSIEQLLSRSPDALVVATDGDTIAGSIVVGWDGWRGTMYRLAVAPEYRRSGIATALVAEAEGRLARQGARRLHLIVDREQFVAEAFWSAVGYTPTGQARFVKNLDT
ncbi:MAG: GNAT family N-acetyltransferase [Acidimicrobiia bacterium]